MASITARKLLTLIHAAGDAYVGTYLYKNGETAPALGILGFRDERVSKTEGVEMLISPVPLGKFVYTAQRHNMEQGYYLLRLIQHAAPRYHLPRMVDAAASQVLCGEIKYSFTPDLVPPYAELRLIIPDLALVNSAPYEQLCPWEC
jgi:hypothetical protein